MSRISLQRHLRTLRRADRRYLEQRFQDLQRAIDLAADEADKKNTELNDVRLRFIPREVFDNYKTEQEGKIRNALIFMFVEGLAIVGLGLVVLGLILREKGI